jgi:hypothetical protein
VRRFQLSDAKSSVSGFGDEVAREFKIAANAAKIARG